MSARNKKAGMIVEGVTSDADAAVRIPLLVTPAGVQIIGGLDGSGNPQSLADAVAAGMATPNASTTAATMAQGTKAVTTAGTPVLLVAATTLVDSVVIQALKGVATANTGNVYVGFSSTGGQNRLVLTPGDATTFQAPAGKKIDLHLIYIDAVTNADAVQYTSVN